MWIKIQVQNSGILRLRHCRILKFVLNLWLLTTFLHGMYYPKRDVFTHIDYTKKQYSGNEYIQKYADSIDGMPIDQYTSCRDLHYKIWCIENGEFTRDTWYKLMMISLSKGYQNLLNEILS